MTMSDVTVYLIILKSIIILSTIVTISFLVRCCLLPLRQPPSEPSAPPFAPPLVNLYHAPTRPRGVCALC